ncbi:hypothetical protein LTR09_001777 [Extremus antarcticus]|uniref:Uncharacterized protein n=1 Tax=Extremus antarcticus TaxID=702011 RepID=A0AAJ0GHC9_9PEZI|nr:hypothetical protein LTR09_001777 [Extremus antarcticus]
MSGEKSLFGGAKTLPPLPETDEEKKQRTIEAKRQQTLATFTKAVESMRETMKKSQAEKSPAAANLEEIRNIEKATALIKQVEEWEKDDELVWGEEWLEMKARLMALLEEAKLY